MQPHLSGKREKLFFNVDIDVASDLKSLLLKINVTINYSALNRNVSNVC